MVTRRVLACMKIKLTLAAVAAVGVAVAPLTAAASAQAAPASSNPPLIIVYLENHSLDQLLKEKADIPYLYSLWTDKSVEQFTQFYSVKHDSFNDYASLAVGWPVADGASKAGQYTKYKSHPLTTTLWNQLSSAPTPVSWGVYEESMPSTCYTGADNYGSTGEYKIGHDPAMPFHVIYPGHPTTACQKVRPLSDLHPSTLPQVSFVTPNLCDDMDGVTASVASSHHYTDCVKGTAALVKRGDSWLKSEVTLWTDNGKRDVDVLIMFDEGEHGDNSGVGGPGTGGGHIYAVLLGPGVASGHNTAKYNAYNLLAGIEKEYALTPRLGNAATAAPIPLP
jgi:phosphatidylinositol-3-phosphatase